MKRSLVVLSGGQDSTTCLFYAKERSEEVHAITFDYGQNHRIEIESAKKVAEMAGVKSFEVINVAGTLKSTSPLTNNGEGLERYENAQQMHVVIGDRIEKTFVPMRNQLFLTIAYNRAVDLNCQTIYTGICEEDNANYPDCTSNFRDTIEVSSNYALGNIDDSGNIKPNYIDIKAPLLNMSKVESVKLAYAIPGCWEALAYSHTSYDGKYPPTDMNHSNVLRAKGFEDAGLPDPLVLRAWVEGYMPLPETTNYDKFLHLSHSLFANKESMLKELLNV